MNNNNHKPVASQPAVPQPAVPQANDNHKNNEPCGYRFPHFVHYVNVWFDNFTNDNFMNKHILALKALSKIHGDTLTPEAAYKHAMIMFKNKMLTWSSMADCDRKKEEIELQKWSSKIRTWVERGKYFWSGRKWICRNCEKGKCECNKSNN